VLGKAHRVLGYFLFMLGTGLVLESGAQRVGVALALLGAALFARGLWLIRPSGAAHRAPAPVIGSEGGAES
jgi:hypothetical protein